MTYKETTEYLFNTTPLFQQIGKGAYKEGLENTYTLDEHFEHPHTKYKTIHVAGTNGKGSCSHTLAAVLQASGYKVGLYTSPHLIDFRERIRINGEMISEDYVVRFVEKEKKIFEPLCPSFFEITTAMAFRYFADKEIDVAVIEVGLGGRLDCTNIISPDLCIITNISLDHTQFLGDTLTQIAFEKAGIIKQEIPVVIGESNIETKPVFLAKAKEHKAPILFAEERMFVLSSNLSTTGERIYQTEKYGILKGELGGAYQDKNTNTILHAIDRLQLLGYTISLENIMQGFSSVCRSTGLMGRWQIIGKEPFVICDTGHNIAGLTAVVRQLKEIKCQTLRIVIGMVNDKDIHGVMNLLPSDAIYYFTKASVKRALTEQDLAKAAQRYHLNGSIFPTVASAFKKAKADANEHDVIFIGGSTFVVADFLADYF